MEKILLNVDSRFRNKCKYPSSTSFVSELDVPLKNVIDITLSSIEFPDIYYTISEKRKNNCFDFIFKGKRTKITLPNGNYNLESALSNIILQIKVISSSLTIVFSSTTGKITFFSESSERFSLDFTSETIYDSLGKHLGFTDDYYDNVLNITGERIVDFRGDNYFFLKLNDYGRVGMKFNEDYVFSKVIAPSDKFTTLFDNQANFVCKTHVFRQPVDIYKLDIKILDLFGNCIDLLDMNFSMTLEVSIIYSSTLREKSQNKVWN